jgi:hypothetical protein
VILSDLVQSQARRFFSGVGPEGGVANVCGLTGRAQGLGALRPIGQVTRRGILGPDRRAVGVPGGLDYLLGKSEFPVVARPYPAFRSWYEDGCRDVRQLYPAEFYDKITKLPRLPYSSND